MDGLKSELADGPMGGPGDWSELQSTCDHYLNADLNQLSNQRTDQSLNRNRMWLPVPVSEGEKPTDWPTEKPEVEPIIKSMPKTQQEIGR